MDEIVFIYNAFRIEIDKLCIYVKCPFLRA